MEENYMSTNHKLTKTLAVLLSVAFVLSGCATVRSIEGTKEKESLTVAVSGRPATMDSVKADDWDNPVGMGRR